MNIKDKMKKLSPEEKANILTGTLLVGCGIASTVVLFKMHAAYKDSLETHTRLLAEALDTTVEAVADSLKKE